MENKITERPSYAAVRNESDGGRSFFVRETLNGFVDFHGPYTAADLVLCRSGDGWSLHAPGATGFEIADGEAAAIASGPGREPRESDREVAFKFFVANPGGYIPA